MDNLTVKEFTLSVASNEPAPGGGSVSALGGSQAAALLAMYCRLSLGKKGLEDVQESMQDVSRRAEEIMASLLRAIAEDTAAFNEVVAAFKLPKDNDEQKTARKAAVQAAFEKAARVPLDVAEQCLQIMELIAHVVGKGNNSAITDIGVANLQAWSGLQGALYNVEINLTSLKDADLVSELKSHVERIRARGAQLFRMNADVVENLLKGE
ncbi:MAG: cyclodeaminase/cyclohydrolase family protein [Bacillota bacterium]|nr:cyclodeaminase/cyclohydrolase family protein [Bacillota bacterium]MDW7683552.1 cyclodeaminase/cyclohydrolase family protein [Bacillota bacterium]